MGAWNEVYELVEVEIGSPEHEAALKWLETNGIPVSRVPMGAHFALYETKIQIRLFDLWNGHRFISLEMDGFAKREEVFDLVAHPDELGVAYRSSIAVSPSL